MTRDDDDDEDDDDDDDDDNYNNNNNNMINRNSNGDLKFIRYDCNKTLFRCCYLNTGCTIQTTLQCLT